MPEDLKEEEEIRKLSELHLIEQRKKRKAMKGKKSYAEKDAIAFEKRDVGRTVMNEEQKKRLRTSIAKFTHMIYSKSTIDEAAFRQLVDSVKSDQKASVLVIDDNKIQLLTVKLLLSDFGVACDIANSGNNGIKIYKERL